MLANIATLTGSGLLGVAVGGIINKIRNNRNKAEPLPQQITGSKRKSTSESDQDDANPSHKVHKSCESRDSNEPHKTHKTRESILKEGEDYVDKFGFNELFEDLSKYTNSLFPKELRLLHEIRSHLSGMCKIQFDSHDTKKPYWRGQGSMVAKYVCLKDSVRLFKLQYKKRTKMPKLPEDLELTLNKILENGDNLKHNKILYK